ncbi:hypothetical protein BDV06DRAFT_184764 [Aspergillus oleicola]
MCWPGSHFRSTPFFLAIRQTKGRCSHPSKIRCADDIQTQCRKLNILRLRPRIVKGRSAVDRGTHVVSSLPSSGTTRKEAKFFCLLLAQKYGSCFIWDMLTTTGAISLNGFSGSAEAGFYQLITLSLSFLSACYGVLHLFPRSANTST